MGALKAEFHLRLNIPQIHIRHHQGTHTASTQRVNNQ